MTTFNFQEENHTRKKLFHSLPQAYLKKYDGRNLLCIRSECADAQIFKPIFNFLFRESLSSFISPSIAPYIAPGIDLDRLQWQFQEHCDTIFLHIFDKSDLIQEEVANSDILKDLFKELLSRRLIQNISNLKNMSTSLDILPLELSII